MGNDADMLVGTLMEVAKTLMQPCTLAGHLSMAGQVKPLLVAAPDSPISGCRTNENGFLHLAGAARDDFAPGRALSAPTENCLS